MNKEVQNDIKMFDENDRDDMKMLKKGTLIDTSK